MKKLILLFLLCGCGLTYYDEPQRSVPKFPDHLRTADAFVDMHERNNRGVLKEFLQIDPVQYEWCAAFVNSVLRVNSIPGSNTVSKNPLLARSFMDWGYAVETPKMGDIVVFSRGNEGWQGHVGFYMASHKLFGEEYYVILGGNQDNMVSYAEYPASKAIAIRRMDISTD